MKPCGGAPFTPGCGSSTSLGGAGAGALKVTKPVVPVGSSSSTGSGAGGGVGAGMACEGIGVGGPTIGSGIDGVASDGGGVHIGGAADEPPVSTGAPQAKDLNSSEASPPLTLVPWNGAGVSGLAPPPFVSSVRRSTRRASRRQRGPSRLMRISSKSSHASCAFWVRASGSLTSRRSTQSEMRWSTSGRIDFTGAIGSLTWRSRIAIGASESWNGTLPVNSSNAMQPTEYRSVHGPMSCAIACSGAM